ncbi:MAG: GTPase ObgE, partial [Candidatus Margulisbacteria bacterium]|nr:GTPase ObgE [Candidatus Margulisiibacteriota bacterium]
MFIDEAVILVKAGHGGAGGKHFLREKYKPYGGPAGGDGGDGGSVYLETDTGLNSLTEFRYHQEFSAPDGQSGMRNKMAGRNGADITLKIPCGTVVRNAATKKIIVDLTRPDERFLLARGGKGGRGNYHFATSRNQSPRYAQPGLPGEEWQLELELKLIADVGLVGLPNAGKSTLLQALTNARPKIGNYPFTTLSPNLGILSVHKRTIVLADIPGLIEGAADGAGLGDEFLRHIERTKFIVHLLDMSGFSGDPAQNYRIINQELRAYSARLA